MFATQTQGGSFGASSPLMRLHFPRESWRQLEARTRARVRWTWDWGHSQQSRMRKPRAARGAQHAAVPRVLAAPVAGEPPSDVLRLSALCFFGYSPTSAVGNPDKNHGEHQYSNRHQPNELDSPPPTARFTYHVGSRRGFVSTIFTSREMKLRKSPSFT